MATWSEQRPPDVLVPVPPCLLIVRRGEVPDFHGRSNILPWQPALAARSNEWEALRGADGKELTVLPPMGAVPGTGEAPEPVVPGEIAAQDDMRTAQVYSVFANLEPGDFKPSGEPKFPIVRDKSGMDDLSGSEMKALWLRFKEGGAQ